MFSVSRMSSRVPLTTTALVRSSAVTVMRELNSVEALPPSGEAVVVAGLALAGWGCATLLARAEDWPAFCAAVDWPLMIVVSLKYVTVSYGGDNGYGDLYFAGCDGAATDVTVSNSSTWGIYRDSASPTLTRVTYTDNASGELY